MVNEGLCLKTNDTRSLIQTYMLLGILNEKLHRYKRAQEYYFLSVKCAEKTKNYRMLASAYENVANVYAQKSKLDTANTYILKSIYYRKLTSDFYGLSSAYFNLSLNYFNQSKLREAERFGMKALSLSREIKHTELLPYCYENLAEIQLANKSFKSSSIYLDSSIYFARLLRDNVILEMAYKIRSIVDTLNSNYKLGLRDYITYKMYTDSIMIKENSQKLIEAELKTDFEKRKEILRLKSESEIQIQKLIRNVLLFIVLIALIFAVILYNQRNKIAIQKQEVEEQKNIIADKSREVLDSIEYAKKIQQAILPSDRAMKSLLPKIFCLYIPKDIVAGDFYWLEKRDQYIYIASCDCTGHGVPGAMVSVVCNNALNRSLNEFHEIDTNKILDRTRSLVLENFSKSESAVLDGMDISLARIDTSSNELMWSGAYSPLWIVRNGELTIITGDKQPIGNFENYVPFTSHTIKLESNDSIYLFSDGYCDQFGGPNDKKFSKARLKPLIEECYKLTPSDQYKLLYNTHLNWRGNQTQIDDITIIGFSIS
jgi:serine phosphatase RsbU (regulator of sigma subunit)